MDLMTGAMASLLPKLAELIQEEYHLHAGVKKDIESLSRELVSMEAALSKVAEVPRDQLDKQVRLWADNVRELSYEMEDVVDVFMVRVEGTDPADDIKSSKRLRMKIANFFKKTKTRHQVGEKIQEIKIRVKEVADLRDKYKVDDVRANPVALDTVDPRVLSLFKDQRELVGIDEPRDELIKRLADGDDGVANSNQQLKMLSIFGFGGLGKTTLAKAVYDKLQAEFVCKAFVSVGQNPSVKKVLVDILLQLDEASYLNATTFDVEQLVRKLRGLLDNKRYIIVIDDIWDIKSWEIIRCSWVDSKCGSVVITTTRILEVAKEADHVYKHEPLSRDNSRELFYKQLSFRKGDNSYDQSAELSEKILQKCGGVPLAIIIIASLLAGKPRENWSEVYGAIGFGHGDNIDVDNTRRVLLYSYYDLPRHLRTCLLHLSIYPADYEIEKKTLIWKWVAEGFIREEPMTGLFEVGQRYFSELINRSMIQPVQLFNGIISACRVHDLVLDMIYSLSMEENFVAVLDSDEQHTCPKSNARRLTIQKRSIDQLDVLMASTSMPRVRSFSATMCRLSTMASLSSFKVLRVLALEGCTFMEDHSFHLEHLGKLLQLRYLGVSGTPITELPPEIGNLLFLQTLDLERTKIKELPQSVGQLRKLKCLHLDGDLTGVSDWIGKLASLEELWLGGVSLDFVKELGKLTELREFKASLDVKKINAELFNHLMESLGNLHKLQSHRSCLSLVDVKVRVDQLRRPRGPSAPPLSGYGYSCISQTTGVDRFLASAPPVPLVFESEEHGGSGRGDPRGFSCLNTLFLFTVGPDVVFLSVMGGGAFPKLRHFDTSAIIRYLQGAMPSLEQIHYWIIETYHPSSLDDFHFPSIGNLPSLQKIGLTIYSSIHLEVKAVLRHTVDIHPNRPTLWTS